MTVLDTHAGAGLYRLDGDYASTSGEAADGILRLVAPKCHPLTPALQAYVEHGGGLQPRLQKLRCTRFTLHHASACCAAHDKLKLFELHPTDMRALAGNVAQLEAGTPSGRAARGWL